jgi:hypothetical protein
MDGPTKAAQHFQQERGGGNAIDIVIAEYDQWFLVRMRPEETFDRDCHIRQKERIGQMLESWFEVIADGVRLRMAAVEEALREQWRNSEILREASSEQWLGRQQ